MGWVSVGSRLPDYGEPVWVTSGLGLSVSVWSLDWDDDGDFWRDEDGWAQPLEDVDFWASM